MINTKQFSTYFKAVVELFYVKFSIIALQVKHAAIVFLTCTQPAVVR